MVLLKQRGRFVPACFAEAEVSFCLFSFVCLFSLSVISVSLGCFCLRGYVCFESFAGSFEVRVKALRNLGVSGFGFAIFLQAVSWAPVAALKACFCFSFSLTDHRLPGVLF